MDEVTLYDPEYGRPVTTAVPAEVVRLLAAGYSTTEPFQPEEHTVEEVVRHLTDEPADAARVVAAEKAGKRRTTILGHAGDEAAAEPAAGDTGPATT